MRFSEENEERFFKTDEPRTETIELSHYKSERHPNKLRNTESSDIEYDLKISKSSSSNMCKARPEDLKIAADMVVKYLTPAFKEGRIASKVSIRRTLILYGYWCEVSKVKPLKRTAVNSRK